MSSELTEKEELYCQYRASGYTKSRAASKAYETAYPKQLGYNTELKEDVQERIKQLKEERAENANLDVHEQIRRYNELYMMALDKSNLALAKQMLERIDAIGGFDAPSKSISMNIKGDSGEALKGQNIKQDIEKFAKILDKHSQEEPSKVVH